MSSKFAIVVKLYADEKQELRQDDSKKISAPKQEAKMNDRASNRRNAPES